MTPREAKAIRERVAGLGGYSRSDRHPLDGKDVRAWAEEARKGWPKPPRPPKDPKAAGEKLAETYEGVTFEWTPT